MKTYSEKLKDPLWQKKRLEILNRDNFTCCFCKSKENTLSVHHKTYIYENDVWDYPNENFLTLCSDCHSEEEWGKRSIKHLINYLLLNGHSHTSLYQTIEKYIPELCASGKDYENIYKNDVL